ncbi:hypothetical protein BDV26DRAFT_304335 [Aspergillus bertholletiae]|uniref:Integrase core domain-containing protein n=1 Tax=Aspergillus bertholletiae TaxID=1226010 RepID=A0A5N7B9A5_9EURO|nr:hypothetical protein BDV26DRAFT_304335 [Aspergillus bertholletiae]
MPSAIDLSQYKEIIISLFEDNTSAQSIADYLLSTHAVKVKERTIRQRLLNTLELRARIIALYYNFCFSDAEILGALMKKGLKKQSNMLLSREEADKALLEAIEKELDEGAIEGLDRCRLYAHCQMRTIYLLQFGGATLQASFKLRDLPRHKGAYIIPGPNYLWSVDGSCKLQLWGIEIYAVLEAYIRYIVWLYVGVPNHTAKNIAQQYLQTIKTQNLLPRPSPGAQLNECFQYGTSTAAQKVEAWWDQLTKGSIDCWLVLLFRKDYFQGLAVVQAYDQHRKSDTIAILAIYIPIIRQRIHAFVRLWNIHTIRRQSKRPHSVSGRPAQLYFFPSGDIQDYGTRNKRLQNLDTLNWCTEQLKQLGCSNGTINGFAIFSESDDSQAHAEIYLQLRDRVRAHMESGELPVLDLLLKLVDNWPTIQTENMEMRPAGVDICNEGPVEKV